MAFKLLNCVYFDAHVFSFLAWMLSLYCCSSYKNWSIGRLICFQMLPAISSYRGSSRKEIISLFRCSYKLGVLLLQNHIFFLIHHISYIFYQKHAIIIVLCPPSSSTDSIETFIGQILIWWFLIRTKAKAIFILFHKLYLQII